MVAEVAALDVLHDDVRHRVDAATEDMHDVLRAAGGGRRQQLDVGAHGCGLARRESAGEQLDGDFLPVALWPFQTAPKLPPPM